MVRAHVANLQEGSEGDRPLASVHKGRMTGQSRAEKGKNSMNSMAKIGIYGKVIYGNKK